MEWIIVIPPLAILWGMIIYVATHPQQPSEAWQAYERICYEPIWKVEYTPIVEPEPIKVTEPVVDHEVVQRDYPTHWYN